ncbi:MAG: efflux RND transporter periplasmic adaptor subunit [Desulfatiglandales bacterium]
MKKIIPILVVVACLGLIGWKIQQRFSQPKGLDRDRRDVAVAVDISPIKKASIRDTGVFVGSLLARSRFVVAPKISGRLEKLFVHIGDPVRNGQLIAVLDDDEYRQQVDQARAELEVARATLEESRITHEIAKRELERTAALREKKIASESELDTARAQYNNQEAKRRVAMAQLAQRQAALRAAEIRLSYSKIHVSWEDENGARFVGERFVDEGALLAPNTPIASILDISSITAVIHVIERDYSLISVGKEALVSTDAFPGQTFPGKVIRIAPLLKEASRQARVEIEIPNPEHLLKPGMFVRAQLAFEEHEDTKVVPIAALVEREGQRGLFLVDPQERKAHFVPVTTGIVNGDRAEILSPDVSGWVVTLGHHLLEDGSSVILSGDGPGGPAATGGTRAKPEKSPEKKPGETP